MLNRICKYTILRILLIINCIHYLGKFKLSDTKKSDFEANKCLLGRFYEVMI